MRIVLIEFKNSMINHIKSVILFIWLLLITTSCSKTAEDYYYSALSESDFQKSMELFNKAIELNPAYSDAYLGKGNKKATFYHSDYQGAIEDFSMAIDIDPNNVRAYYARANAKKVLGDYKDALHDYDKAIEIGRRNNSRLLANFYTDRGELKAEINDHKGAVEDFYEAKDKYDLSQFSQELNLYIDLGKSLAALGEHKKAINYFTDNLIVRNTGNAYMYRALSRHELGHHSKAFQDINAAISLSPSFTFYYARADMKKDLRDYRGAIEDYTKGVNQETSRLGAFLDNTATAFHNRGVSNLKIGEKNRGCLDFSKAGELGYEKAYDSIDQHCR